MKRHKPSQRETDLHLVLSYCATTIFSQTERFAINQERAKLSSGDSSYNQNSRLEEKIQATLAKINDSGWEPKKI